MRFKLFLTFSATLLIASFIFAQSNTPEAPTAETTAFQGITDLFRKMKQGGDHPSEDDYKTRREAGLEMAARARQFLKDYPTSKNAEDAQGLWSIGLSEATLAGDTNAAVQLKTRAAEMIKDPKVPDMMKLHAFSVNYLTEWGRKNGKRSLDDDSPDSQKAYAEAFFAAANVLSNKDDIFKMALLQAKSGRGLSDEEKRSIAQRVLDNTNASPSIQAMAREILSGEKTYAVGKPLELSFVAVDGRKINLADMKGKVVLINFWATWCGPCVAEMPKVKHAYDKYHADGFEILGISLDESKDDLLRFLKKNEIAWPQYFDGKHWNNDISFRFGINSVPTEWLIDKKGILREVNTRGDLEQTVGAFLREK
ncbi:MAG TPA: TlpA disulfide reductase family protein [Verrucomicrobiae bacterium]|jgi:thiol-disulfide isomerase/thioredoxin